ncbi:putative wall-associated receptor kinase-like 16 [Ananas comosus]|uniref:Wall-associated receptor kinase-like 16 n=1 Tax=Ananas comosus TaxID=4615 RepID=A0A6P5EAH8_ANACO|nr:putative wall-associated receptor kinase-like 16 [Ananas comosus]
MDSALKLMARRMVFLLLMQLPVYQLAVLSSAAAAAAAAETTSGPIALPGCPGKCGNRQGAVDSFPANITMVMPYRFSNKRNKFTAIGCHTLAYIVGQNGQQFACGCASFCDSLTSPPNGSCSGIGCCQTAIPKDVDYFETRWGFPTNLAANITPCRFAMLVEEDSYNFSTSDLLGFVDRNQNGVPVVLDWAAGDLPCQAAKGSPNYACRSKNSYCYDSAIGTSYLCNCSEGYEGNPYLDGGCTDIDECNSGDRYPCHGTCTNLPGSYDCTCPKGTQGNPLYQNCTEIPDKFSLKDKLAVGACVGATIALALCFITIIELQKRRHIREKAAYFKQNGGQILHEEMTMRKVDTVRIFTENDLRKATNNFDKDRLLGSGGRGMVYTGILENDREVAVKKPRIVDEKNYRALTQKGAAEEDQREEFVNEIIILSRINHRNVVKLLGCCFEVPVPMLVYEFISNGTLFDYLHGENSASPIPLDARLKIAADSAEALAYLHSSTCRPIIHGDVKSLNILLDDNYEAKVSDFGASKLVPLDEDQFVMLVQRIRGYLDPECLHTHKLTDKSDVYSFGGVVLLELITRKKAIYMDGSSEKKSLASSFVSMVNQNKLQDIVDDQIREDGAMEVLQEVAAIAVQCLRTTGEERPPMKDVAEDLRRLIRFQQHPWGQKNPEEAESLLGSEPRSYSIASDAMMYQSQEDNMMLNIKGGR